MHIPPRTTGGRFSSFRAVVFPEAAINDVKTIPDRGHSPTVDTGWIDATDATLARPIAVITPARARASASSPFRPWPLTYRKRRPT